MANIENYVGKVVALREYNGYDDSDFYATVEVEPGKFEEVMYGTTRGGGGWGAVIDATPDVLERYEAHLKARRDAARKRAEVLEASVPRKGRRVRVAKGRKVPIGTEGVVIWLGKGNWGARVGIKDDAGAVHWTAASNVEVEGVDYGAVRAAEVHRYFTSGRAIL